MATSHELDTKDNDIVLSETEMTQELPELEEHDGDDGVSLRMSLDTEQKKLSTSQLSKRNAFNDSQDIVYNRRHIRRKQRDTMEDSDERGSDTTSPRKRLKREIEIMNSDLNEEICQVANEMLADGDDVNSNPIKSKETFPDLVTPIKVEKKREFPSKVKTEDSEYLTKRDIRFEDAIWCQYSLNYKYYPALLLSPNIGEDSSLVLFETGKAESKNEDIYYLDIRIGDTVTFNTNEYSVSALECRTHDPQIIRCIRGYDTVHLKKRNANGSLSKKVVIKPLASITVELNEWARRPKIILEDGVGSRGKALRGLRHPLRGRKTTNYTSPKKLLHKLIKEEHIVDDSTNSIDKFTDERVTSIMTPTQKSLTNFPSSATRDQGYKIFDKCLFVLTSIFENKDELCSTIEARGGKVLTLGFSSLFDCCRAVSTMPVGEDEDIILKESSLHLTWKRDCIFKDYKFACLLTRRHLRSLKYLETLALGWPILHWKFINACVKENTLSIQSIPRFLLPAGESYRLSVDITTKSGVIKSSDILQFYSRLLNGDRLINQTDALKNLMMDYVVLLYGYSELDDFIKFIFACTGISRFYETDMKLHDDAPDSLLLILEKLFKLCQDKGLKILVYMNEETGKISNDLLDQTRKEILERFSSFKVPFHVRSKEWLIQTIINESTDFDDENY